MTTILLSEPLKVQSRLQELGLTEEILREAVEAGERVRRTFTANHPLVVPGLMRWAETIKVIRDRLMASGWTKSDIGGVPLIIHPKGLIALTVMTGNEGTGNDSAELRSKNPRGSTTIAFIKQNAEQLEFDRTVLKIKAAETKQDNPMMWYLAVNCVGNDVRFELSLPLGMNNGHIEDWQERIMFTPIDFDPSSGPIENPFEKSEDIVVEVSPKF